MKKISRKQWLGGIAIAVMILLTIIVPPNRSQITEGSTFSRSPSGYAAWYDYMETQGIKMQRWKKDIRNPDYENKKPITLIQIKPELEDRIGYWEEDWVNKGNNLIILGVKARPTPASFSSVIPTKSGDVKIDTTRRRSYTQSFPNEQLAITGLMIAKVQPNPDKKNLLGDEFGSIIWKSQDKGTLTAVVTPYLAANAYQNESGNFKFLAELVTAAKTPIYVDEFIHGYKDADSQKSEVEKTWIAYLGKTPLFAGAVQALFVLIIFIIAQNRRFGAAIAQSSESINNSQAYIEALGSVLKKADRHEFVWQAIAKAEQKKLQQKLGIGNQDDQQTLLNAWVQHTGRPKADLEHLLNAPKTKVSEQELLKLLQAWQQVLSSL